MPGPPRHVPGVTARPGVHSLQCVNANGSAHLATYTPLPVIARSPWEGRMQVSTKVRQLLADKGADVCSIRPEASVYEALELMASRNIGSLAVMAGGSLIGIVSERDYARKVVLLGRASRETRVADVMTSEVIVVGLDDTVKDCMRLMTERKVRHLPVVEAGSVVGLVSIGDVVKAIMSEQSFVIEQLQTYIQGGSGPAPV